MHTPSSPGLRRTCVLPLLVLLTTVLPLNRVLGATPERAAILSDTGGPIRALVLHYDGQLQSELEPMLADLFAKLPPDIKVQVMCANVIEVAQFLSRWSTAVSGSGRQLQVFNVSRPLSVWARDRRLAREYPRSHVPADTFVPATTDEYCVFKENDLMVPALLNQTGWGPQVTNSLMHLEGGNVVANNRHVFVGANVVEENLRLGLEREDIDRELQRILGRQYTLVGGCEFTVPWCHVDMYLTPVDDHTVLIASPELAAELRFSSPHPVDDRIGDDTNESSAVQALYDSVALQIARLGYRIVRLPALVSTADAWMVTYNNVIMEHCPRGKTVYMPVYGIAALDDAARRTYMDLGFSVQTIDVSGIYRLGGAIRCLANVTERSPRERCRPGHAAAAAGRVEVHLLNTNGECPDRPAPSDTR